MNINMSQHFDDCLSATCCFRYDVSSYCFWGIRLLLQLQPRIGIWFSKMRIWQSSTILAVVKTGDKWWEEKTVEWEEPFVLYCCFIWLPLCKQTRQQNSTQQVNSTSKLDPRRLHSIPRIDTTPLWAPGIMAAVSSFGISVSFRSIITATKSDWTKLRIRIPIRDASRNKNTNGLHNQSLQLQDESWWNDRILLYTIQVEIKQSTTLVLVDYWSVRFGQWTTTIRRREVLSTTKVEGERRKLHTRRALVSAAVESRPTRHHPRDTRGVKVANITTIESKTTKITPGTMNW